MPQTILLLPGLTVALVYLWATQKPPSVWRSVIKTVPVASFAMAAAFAGAPWLLCAALGLSAVGDLALSRPGERAFLAGLGAFACAHLAFIALFWAAGSGNVPLAPAIALVALGLSTERWLIPHVGALRWPVRAYIAVIVGMGVAATMVNSAVLVLGAGCFIVSDLILALHLFRLAEGHPLKNPAARALWVLYIAAQALIFAAFFPTSLP